jgi:hypothetical protein
MLNDRCQGSFANVEPWHGRRYLPDGRIAGSDGATRLSGQATSQNPVVVAVPRKPNHADARSPVSTSPASAAWRAAGNSGADRKASRSPLQGHAGCQAVPDISAS